MAQLGVAQSAMNAKYGQAIDRESAYEILNARVAEARPPVASAPAAPARAPKAEKPAPSVIEELSKNVLVRQVARSAASQLTRSIFGTLLKRR